MTFSPRRKTIAYRIWCYADPRGWDCTAGEIADALDITYQAVGHVCRIEGWTGRLRVTTQHAGAARGHWGHVSEELLGGAL